MARILKAGGLRIEKMKKKPCISNKNKKRRLDQCNEWINGEYDFDSVVFSDEKRFRLDGPDGNSNYWRDPAKKPLYKVRRQNGGGSVMVWGAIGIKGKSELICIDERVNSQIYQELLRSHLLPTLRTIGGDTAVFQQDNAPAHVSNSTLEFFRKENVSVLAWPANSPDLNPIENVWGKMSQIVYQNCKQYYDLEKLKMAIVSAWHDLKDDLRLELFKSMNRRCHEVVKGRGGPTRY